MNKATIMSAHKIRVAFYLWAGLYAALLFWVKFPRGNALRAARGKLPPTGYGVGFICGRGFMPRFYFGLNFREAMR